MMAPALLLPSIQQAYQSPTSPSSYQQLKGSSSLSSFRPFENNNSNGTSSSNIPRSGTSSGDSSRSTTPTQSSTTPGLAMAYYTQRRLQKQNSMSMLRISPTLPDITESPTTPTNPAFGGSSERKYDRTSKTLKRLSTVSDNSDSSDSSTSTINTAKIRYNGPDLDGVESEFGGSVFDGMEGEEDMWRAEIALAGAKKRLDTFETNMKRARDSLLVISPPFSPTIETLGRSDSLTRRPSTSRAFPISTGPSTIRAANNHIRTVSESAVPSPARTSHNGYIDAVLDSPRAGSSTEMYRHKKDDDRESERSTSSMSYTSVNSRNESTKQMRELRDQMQNLRGKITSLTERNRRDSLRRRSLNNMRGTPLTNLFQPPEPSTPVGRSETSSAASFHTVTEGDWVEAESENGSECQTPRAFQPLRKSMSYEELGYDTAFSLPGEVSTPFVSYPRRNRVRNARSGSSSGSSTTSSTAHSVLKPGLRPPPVRQQQLLPLQRSDSYDTVSSYATAAEDASLEETSPRSYGGINGFSHQRTISRSNGSPLRTIQSGIVFEGDYLENNTNGADDGYHSAPATPGSDVASSDQYSPKTASVAPAITKRVSPLTAEALQDMQGPLPLRKSSSSAAKSATDSIIGPENDELSLKLPNEDRQLVEALCEQLGKVCCRMELDQAGSYDRKETRRRLEVALAVLQGQHLS